MNRSMERLRVKREITDTFTPGQDPIASAGHISDEDLEKMLDAISSAIPFPKAEQNHSLSLFLYAGCRRFDRWFAPSPYIVPVQHRARFSKFVSALKRAEHGDPTNCATFELHEIRDDLFAAFDEGPIAAVDVVKLSDFDRRIARILAPQREVKRNEYFAQKEDLRVILDGIRDGSLRTEFKFDVPYVIHEQHLDVGFTWKGTCGCMEARPQFRPSGESFVNVEGGVALSVGASRWQTGTSTVIVQIAALVDGSAYTERLQAIAGHEFPVPGWPKSFTTAFEIFHDVVSQLRERHGGRQDWIPAPRDLSHLEFCLRTSKKPLISWLVKGSPASVMEAFSAPQGTLTIELGEIGPVRWVVECKSRAKMYLELGDTNEALFWLNVGVEALISTRFVEIENRTGIIGLADELGGPKEFWAQSEEVLVRQFPEMSGKVKWPTARVHASVFGKLKALYRRLPMHTSIDDLLRRYSEISGERNDLFHGNRSGRVSVTSVLIALAALDWVDDNMWPSKAA